ncbi:hypothetical protein R3P38DRAFT_2874196 [Favolaschia claudopus]|uniref:Uncharacterized protein n=1 Tax=Favolaschia claudopus TaxID=2862362 RepID=A0AAW0D4N0_9AGAR
MSEIPRRGTFAAMTIDPYASLAHVEGSATLWDELCSQVESQAYVVYIADVSPELHDDDGEGEHDPKPEPRPQKQSRFRRSRLPEQQQPPTFRDVIVEFPLAPSHPLPFQNGYLAPFVVARVRVAGAGPAPFESYMPSGATYYLSKTEQLRHDTEFEKDRQRRGEALVHRASIVPGADADIEVPPTPTSPVGMSMEQQQEQGSAYMAEGWSDTDTMRAGGSGAGIYADVEEGEEKEDIVMNGSLYRNAVDGGGIPHGGLSVVFSYDLEQVGKLRSPVGFFEEGERVEWIAQSLRYKNGVSGDDGESRYDARTGTQFVVDSLKAKRLRAKILALGKNTVRRLNKLGLLPSSAADNAHGTAKMNRAAVGLQSADGHELSRL